MEQNNNTLVNGDFASEIGVQDRGLAYGDGVFRTMRVVNGKPLHWVLHYQKLSADCAAIGIVCPSASMLAEDLAKLFPKSSDDLNAVAKIIITRGIGKRGYAPPAVVTPLRVVMKLPMPTYPDDYFVNGARLHLCDIRLSKQPKLAGIKHLNRLENVLARMEWQDEHVFDGLLMDQDEHVIECTMSNLFCRYQHTLKTPRLNDTGVAGITRQQVLAKANLLALEAIETQLSLAEVLAADEVLITNSLFGVIQVKQIQETTWPALGLAANFRELLDDND